MTSDPAKAAGNGEETPEDPPASIAKEGASDQPEVAIAPESDAPAQDSGKADGPVQDVPSPSDGAPQETPQAHAEVLETETEIQSEPPSEKDPDTRPEYVDELASQIEGTTLAIDRLTRQLAEQKALIKRKDDIIREMNSDLQAARSGIDLAILRPALASLVRLYADLNADILDQKTDTAAAAPYLKAYQIRVLNAMYDLGLIKEEATDLAENPVWDASRQEISGTIDSDDPSQHQQVHRITMPAFSYNGKAVFRERVEVIRRSPQSKTKSGVGNG